MIGSLGYSRLINSRPCQLNNGIAEALGYRPSTIERHAIGSAAVYSQYIAARREMA